MKLEDKDFVMSILGMPRLGLSQAQISAIERVIDRPAAAGCSYVTYEDAMAALGITTTAGVRKLVREGHLVKFCLPGRTNALGVTRESLEKCLQARGAA